MDIIVEKAGSITIVMTGKRIDSNNAVDYERILENLLNDGIRNLLIDLNNTDYVGSAGLRVFLITAKKIKKSEGKFGMCQIKPHVYEVFEAAGFHKIFQIFPNREDGMLYLLSTDS